ncbi:L,D-transpeptidase [Amycolatopsis suaedae]|uniref:Murein L,D-transpeptidase n=1 Tax=Amycolatopsis suaedae TaxID=2510978 RepID=A0A4Q7JD41_9PSEU|nr:L,D-transpeptidase [Amycolatopsis suaedae]RZQ65257.1 murein L,D-transpeptidase [Amycolatopsis suaedae]
MRKLLVAVTGIAAAAVLAACGQSTPAGGSAVPAPVAPVAPADPAPVAESPSSSPAPPTSSATPKPVAKKEKPKPAPAPGVPCSITSGACVDLSAKKSWLIENGKVVYGPVKITAGKKGHATPVGTFRVISKVKNYHSRQFDAPMPNSVFFIPGIAFHTGSLSQQSHGCIHLSPAASAKYFSTLSNGDAVQVVR